MPDVATAYSVLREAAEYALAALNDPEMLGDDAKRRLRAALVLQGCPMCGRVGRHWHGDPDDKVWWDVVTA